MLFLQNIKKTMPTIRSPVCRKGMLLTRLLLTAIVAGEIKGYADKFS